MPTQNTRSFFFVKIYRIVKSSHKKYGEIGSTANKHCSGRRNWKLQSQYLGSKPKQYSSAELNRSLYVYIHLQDSLDLTGFANPHRSPKSIGFLSLEWVSIGFRNQPICWMKTSLWQARSSWTSKKPEYTLKITANNAAPNSKSLSLTRTNDWKLDFSKPKFV